jgi:hypothetical protein
MINVFHINVTNLKQYTYALLHPHFTPYITQIQCMHHKRIKISEYHNIHTLTSRVATTTQ